MKKNWRCKKIFKNVANMVFYIQIDYQQTEVWQQGFK